jgi:hypothetical protein
MVMPSQRQPQCQRKKHRFSLVNLEFDASIATQQEIAGHIAATLPLFVVGWGDMPTPKVPTKRSIAAKKHAEEKKQRKLHVIGERRAAAHGMTKKEFIAEIVKGKFRPITQEDIEAEPEVEVEAAPEAEAPALAEKE